MCGRYVHPDSAAIERAWHVGRDDGDPFEANYNVAPTTAVPILRLGRETGAVELTRARWGFIPHWWKNAKAPQTTINARSEEVAAKPMWRDAWRRSRCIIPASGWYEWREMDRVDPETGEVKPYKQPYFMRRPDGAPFCFAGLMAWWQPADADAGVVSCAILTRGAEGRPAEVHDRMPVILPDDAHATWLDRTVSDPAPIAERAEADFVYAPVSTALNRRGAEGAALIEPVALPA
jgi:putative SOS response-associated peptidase YedK